MYYPREIREPWLRTSEQFPVMLLTGPRQIGKTTLLRHICEKNRKYVTLDDPGMRGLANEDPALFLQRFSPPVLIDEIQYAPAVLPHIKMIVDSQRKAGAFWLTGSQQFLMMKGVSETLAGRVAIVNLLGFSGRERHKLKLDVPPMLPEGKNIALYWMFWVTIISWLVLMSYWLVRLNNALAIYDPLFIIPLLQAK